uniref:cyclic AMP-responsive element-binding protein 1-like n=1 Tax=Gasterosteus aculeatus aculeatus TaxID=481459 RepID=UPI001A9848AB|nr:cyclic AMP-responsive element-binding protein 1-like [Gasterosteus aculeatus aculeatus]XP_040037435.1 cyclic AMP-responsive element-binding protein 1-like [Gasterosteus aculeatus aculeatus]XP_040037444.1 cyclic AMP-responsive element-binding protein 1-like [Gasterosteus aculeatus aculeatus]
MTMEAGADTQQSGETVVSESEAQHITLTQASIAASQLTTGGSTVTLVQLPNGQTVQVHGVIQAAQPSVIQSPQVQTVQISTVGESEDSQESVDSVTDCQKRREILSRRPSYRKILNDLSSDVPAVPRIEEEKSEDDSAPPITTVTMPTPIYQTSSGQYIAITQGGAIQLANNGTDGVQGMQTLTMANAGQGGATILQYAQTSDGQQILVPSNQVVVQASSGDVQAYQIRTAPTSAITPGVVMATSPALGSGGGTEEVTRKREVRLMKNREAARECRRKKKEYVKCLENRVAVLENQNKTLIEELKALKDLYCHKSE